MKISVSFIKKKNQRGGEIDKCVLSRLSDILNFFNVIKFFVFPLYKHLDTLTTRLSPRHKARGTVLRHFLISPTELLWSQHKQKGLQPEQTPEASQVSSTGRCCSWSGRRSCSLPATGRPCHWGRHTPHRWCEPGPPERVTAHKCQAGGRPVECCWHPGKSGEIEQG